MGLHHRLMRYAFLGFGFLGCVAACSSNDDDSGTNPPPNETVTAAELCASINKRADVCGGGRAELGDCTKNANFLGCLYAPPFLARYSSCRGNTVCTEKAGDDDCVYKGVQSVDANAVTSCATKADACDDGPNEWDKEVCYYPAFQANFKKSVADCLALAGCAEQKTCLNQAIDSIRRACPK
ncbi:hypothetical protein LZC95_30085 [Pendulispora brunnea]|uniref:Lipoprotein n=1 Tax=Pendulispora brunnea TaxID=2905690 RepID=A0ABZ2JW46_9BACT